MMENIFIMDVAPNYILNFIRTFLIFIDMIVYTFVEILFRAVFNLSNFELVGFYEIFEKRVYVILGIFMLFKVTISLITYLVNPDKITDKEQGAGKVITRIMTVLIMLIALPTFFNLMTELQNKLLPVIPKIIIGTSSTLSDDSVTGVAGEMSLTLLQGFAHKKEECTNIQEVKDTAHLHELVRDINVVCSADNNIYAYDYFPIISTLVGALACYVVFSLCISVAIRAFKLIILRMIAPIPVISYIDPKSAKDGAFSHWSKTFLSTWAELFIHIGIIYFIVYIIDFILSADAWTGFFDVLAHSGAFAFMDGILLLAFLIIGLLFFAKSAPQFIFDALGIKTKGGFTRMLGMGAAAAGGIGAARAAFRARQEYDRENRPGENHRLRNLGASLFSGLGAASNGGNALLTADKPNLMTGFDAQAKSNATMLSRISAGSTLGGRLGAIGEMLIAGETEADRNEREINKLKAQKTSAESIKSRISGEMVKQDWTYGSLGIATDVHGNAIGDVNYKDFLARMNAAKTRGDSSLNFYDSNGNALEITMEEAERNLGLLQKNNEDYYLQHGSNQVLDASGNVVFDGDETLANSLHDLSERGINITNRSQLNNNIESLGRNIINLERENARHVANRRGSGNKGN